jgi:YggT family protein
MTLFWGALYIALLVFWLLVIARLVIEFTRMFARSWFPTGVAAVGLETVYTATDPPIRALRRLMPPVRLGTANLDLSVLVLSVLILIARAIVWHQVV